MEPGYRPQTEKSRYDQLAQAFARTRLGGWLFIRVFPAIDRRLIPLTKGRLMVAVGSRSSCCTPAARSPASRARRRFCTPRTTAAT
ncbi:MAG: hypothetical protein ACXVHX_10175 [Solirubrobacteraceae bacterium]